MIKIIIVEDDPIKANKVKSFINENFDILELILLSDLISAKKALAASKFDLMILDIQIPLRIGEDPIKDCGLSFIKELDISTRLIKPDHIIGLTVFDDHRNEFMDRWICIKYDSSSSHWVEALGSNIRYIIECKKKKMGEDIIDKSIRIKNLIETGEDKFVEFKETLQQPVLSKNDYKEIEELTRVLEKYKAENDKNNVELTQTKINTIKTKPNNKSYHTTVNFATIKELSAFANSEGGTLLIGVNDNKVIVGIEKDIQLFKNKDCMRLGFDELIKFFIGDFFHDFIFHEFLLVDGKDLFVINVKKSQKTPVFVKYNEKKEPCEIFFIRAQGSARQLEGRQLIEYIDEHFKK